MSTDMKELLWRLAAYSVWLAMFAGALWLTRLTA